MKVTYMEIATARGKRGGVVGGTWKGINWLRKRIVPSNPRSGPQSDNRATLATAVAATNAALVDPTTYQTWADWAASNSFRSKNGDGTQFLPPYQSALTVVLNRLQYGFSADAATLPTTTSPAVLPDTITVNASGTTLQIAAFYLPDVFVSQDQLKFWVALISPNRKPTFGLARTTVSLAGNPLGEDTVMVSGLLSPGATYDVWVSRYLQGAKEAAVPTYLGRVTIAPSTVTDTTSTHDVNTGSPNTLHFSVTGPIATPTGTVQLLVNGSVTGTGILDGSGHTTIDWTPDSDGTYSVSAHYEGDAVNGASTSTQIPYVATTP